MLVVFALALLGGALAQDVTVHMKLKQHWSGNFEGSFSYTPTYGIKGWELKIHFSVPVHSLQQWDGDYIQKDPNGQNFILVNKKSKGIHPAGQALEIRMMGQYSGSTVPTATGIFVDVTHDSQTLPPLPHHTGQSTKYNYDEVLMKSLLFYAAQRSGKLPANNPISWRGDSALNDGKDVGHDLTGGWYDAGDHVKFGLPMAASTTILAWGLLQWKDAYQSSGQLDRMYDCIKWPLDYFLKAHTGPNELYVQVGDGSADHGYWGRPENMTMARPSYKISTSKPGSDVAGETAAAMAAGYLVFKNKNPAYANKLLSHAKQLYDFSKNHKGLYSTSVPAAAAYYRSASYEDEAVWAGCWLYYATNDAKYLADAEKHHPAIAGGAWGQSWDEKDAGANLLLYKFTKKDTYKQDIVQTYKDWMPGGSITYTPKGLAWRLEWGPLRYAQNMAMIALMAADYGINPASYRKWAMSQVHYALGDAGRSFVVGFGKNPPTKPHHRSASCPDIPATCDWEHEQTKDPDPHVLYGALVGGPGRSDDYVDERSDYTKNEVACDYNAGFQSAVAGLKHLAVHNQLPH
ncbi:endoglucanase 4-like [Liolophura sinensis]|uniref:endoglucanase 4-like n=1 Tax=Liolophura sinensis TaxID=3198878 RepID=UPI0031589941